MPAVDYDYAYYNSGRKVNKATSAQRATKKVGSSVSSTQNRKHSGMSSVSQGANKQQTGTRQATKDQVRKAMYESPKQTQKRKSVANQTATKTTTKRTVKTNYNLDIPEVKNGKKVNNGVNSTSKTQKTLKTVQNGKYNKPAEMKLKKPELSVAQKKKAREKAVSKVKNVLYLIVGFAIAFLICYRYSLIDERFNQLEKTKKELDTAQTVNEQIQADIDSQTDLSYIENFAKYQLGMQKPSNSQIVYVNVEKEDKILTPVTIEEDSESKTWLDQLYEEIMKFFNE